MRCQKIKVFQNKSLITFSVFYFIHYHTTHIYFLTYFILKGFDNIRLCNFYP